MWKSSGNPWVPYFEVIAVREIEPRISVQASSGPDHSHAITTAVFAVLMTWLADPPAYIPSCGEVVRVLEVAPFDPNPRLRVNECVTVSDAEMCVSRLQPQSEIGTWAYVEVGDYFIGTFCRVEKVLAKPAPKSLASPNVAPPHDTRRLAFAANALGPKALAVLADVAERLVLGKAHGDFEKSRDWDREAYEEDLDALVYRTLALRERTGAK